VIRYLKKKENCFNKASKMNKLKANSRYLNTIFILLINSKGKVIPMILSDNSIDMMMFITEPLMYIVDWAVCNCVLSLDSSTQASHSVLTMMQYLIERYSLLQRILVPSQHLILLSATQTVYVELWPLECLLSWKASVLVDFLRDSTNTDGG